MISHPILGLTLAWMWVSSSLILGAFILDFYRKKTPSFLVYHRNYHFQRFFELQLKSSNYEEIRRLAYSTEKSYC